VYRSPGPQQLGISDHNRRIDNHVNWPTVVPPDPVAQAFVADTLLTILAQLTTINKRLEIQSEAISRHDRLLDGSSGVGGGAYTVTGEDHRDDQLHQQWERINQWG
jgi:hypothetical protein